MIAGDISPIDVISHVPIFCEEKDVPYIYVPSKQVLFFNQFYFPQFAELIVGLFAGPGRCGFNEEADISCSHSMQEGI